MKTYKIIVVDEEENCLIDLKFKEYSPLQAIKKLYETMMLNNVIKFIIDDGTHKTISGNYCYSLSELPLYKEYVQTHQIELYCRLREQKEVAQVELIHDEIDITFWLDYCPNFIDEFQEFN